MALEVQPLSGESIEWDAFVRSMPGGSPFHLLAWKRAVDTSFGHRPHYLMAIGEHGIEGVLPLFEVRGLLGGRGLISVPYGVYGGICGRSEPARQLLLDHATRLARHVGAGYVELRHRAGQEMDLPTKSLYVNFSRPISGNDEENLAAIPRKQRRMTRQGLKHGLRAEFGMQHLDAFYDVYARSLHTLGTPVFPRRLFTAISQEFQKECELLTIWKDERVVAGVLTLLYEGQALPYYGGALREAFPYAVNDFMYLGALVPRGPCRLPRLRLRPEPRGNGPLQLQAALGLRAAAPALPVRPARRGLDPERQSGQSEDASGRGGVETGPLPAHAPARTGAHTISTLTRAPE